MKYWLIFILTFALVSCQDVKHPEKPENLIPKDKMVRVLTEAYLANAARSVDNKSLLADGALVDSLIYRKFGIDSLQFAKSNDYYADDINTYSDMFEEVEANLTKMEKKLDSIRKANYKSNDTLPKDPVSKRKDNKR